MVSKVFKKTEAGGDVSFNLTPMIDVTFQLIIFFILTSQIASEALAKVELAKPYEPEIITSDDNERANKIIVNVLFDEDKNMLDENAGLINVSVNGEKTTKEEKLKQWLEAAFKDSTEKKEFFIELRADKRVPYSEVTPIMRLAGEVGIVNMGLTALEDTEKGGK